MSPTARQPSRCDVEPAAHQHSSKREYATGHGRVHPVRLRRDPGGSQAPMAGHQYVEQGSRRSARLGPGGVSSGWRASRLCPPPGGCMARAGGRAPSRDPGPARAARGTGPAGSGERHATCSRSCSRPALFPILFPDRRTRRDRTGRVAVGDGTRPEATRRQRVRIPPAPWTTRTSSHGVPGRARRTRALSSGSAATPCPCEGTGPPRPAAARP